MNADSHMTDVEVSLGGAERHRLHGAIDVLQQVIDGIPAPVFVRRGPSVRTKACTRRSFGLLSEVVHGDIDDCYAGALHDGLSGTQDARRPRVVALEYRGSRQRNQRIDKCKFVLEVPDACEAFTDDGDDLIGAAAP